MRLRLHVHDCESCKWLGSHEGADLYVCHDTIIARFSDDGPDYASTSQVDWPGGKYTGNNPHLIECARRVNEGCDVVLHPRGETQ